MTTCGDSFEHVEKHYNLSTFLEYLLRQKIITDDEHKRIAGHGSSSRVSQLREIITKKGDAAYKDFCDCVKLYSADCLMAFGKTVQGEEADEVRPQAALNFVDLDPLHHCEASQDSDRVSR